MRLENLMDGVLPTEEFMEEELVSLTHEHKVVFVFQFECKLLSVYILSFLFFSFF